MTEVDTAGRGPASKQSAGNSAKVGFAKARAVVVAVANYVGVSSPPEAVLNDARDLIAVLSSADYCGYDPKKIKTLLDSEATLAAVREALADLAKLTEPDDTAFIFFSGHGARLEVNGTDTSVLLPVDTRYDDFSSTTLSEAEFTEALAAISTQRLVVVLDACHSGGAGSLKGAHFKDFEGGFEEKTLERLAQGTGRVIIASSRATETSLVLSGARNSVFTGCLLEALRGRGGTGSDGLIRVFEVFDYVSESVSRTVPGHQHPIFKASNLEDNFPVALKWGGAKNVSGSTSGPRRARSIEDIMSNLYPAGPLEQEIWARAGGDVSRLHLSGTGRATWYSALRTLGQGGGARTSALIRSCELRWMIFPIIPICRP